MSEGVILSLIGVASTIISGWLGHAFGKKRSNAEIATMQLEYIKNADHFYNERINHLQEEVNKATAEIRKLKIIIDKIIEDTCLVEDCPEREYYTWESLDKVMNQKEDKDETRTE